jgi:hypothetical protein
MTRLRAVIERRSGGKSVMVVDDGGIHVRRCVEESTLR